MTWPPFRRPTVAVALGGGAARGLAHVGVLRALEREGIPIDLITGTSMGAIIGGGYAAAESAASLEENVRVILDGEEFRKNKLSFLRETKREKRGLLFSVANLVRKGIFFGVSNMRTSFLSAEAFANSMGRILPQTPIEALPRRFAAVGLDLVSGEEIVMRAGSVRHAATASSAIPGVLPPVAWNGRTLIDGGWCAKVPVLAAFRLGADVVIGVDIAADVAETPKLKRGVDIMMRANALRDVTLVNFSRALSDVLIDPEVGHIHWADFDSWEECMAAGDKATTAMVPAIRALIRRERWLGFFRKSRVRQMAEWHLATDHHDMIVVDRVLPELEHRGALPPAPEDEVDEAGDSPIEAAAAVESAIVTVGSAIEEPAPEKPAPEESVEKSVAARD